MGMRQPPGVPVQGRRIPGLQPGVGSALLPHPPGRVPGRPFFVGGLLGSRREAQTHPRHLDGRLPEALGEVALRALSNQALPALAGPLLGHPRLPAS